MLWSKLRGINNNNIFLPKNRVTLSRKGQLARERRKEILDEICIKYFDFVGVMISPHSSHHQRFLLMYGFQNEVAL